MSHRKDRRVQLPRLTTSFPANDPATEKLIDFTLFPSLPLELRLKIWAIPANVPRMIPFFERRLFSIKYRGEFNVKGKTSVEGQPKIPVLLRVCQESREEALRYYTKCCGAMNMPLYVNFKSDIFHFSATGLENWYEFSTLDFKELTLHKSILNKIQSVQVAGACPIDVQTLLMKLNQLLRRPHVTSLTLVIDHRMTPMPGTNNRLMSIVKEQREDTLRGALWRQGHYEDTLMFVEQISRREGERSFATSLYWSASQTDLVPCSVDPCRYEYRDEREAVA